MRNREAGDAIKQPFSVSNAKSKAPGQLGPNTSGLMSGNVELSMMAWYAPRGGSLSRTSRRSLRNFVVGIYVIRGRILNFSLELCSSLLH